ncbi:flagellar basal body L-ring protein FlgH [Rahnella variigena]|uniref:Flagellar L-ring protein n=1 Tax=Rahnella variigena TaxID=574964 RepID=A0ABX9Q2N5_9GAMM|nr:flagellar basal body L-ring protein FlgH [Rahnella variigena]RJT50041.1 flagellar basal body L-ring protein FlgH [Rahnella variigena]RKF71077.1 flagellar basal body L-ring protein FlgH [Rahnella variigena]
MKNQLSSLYPVLLPNRTRAASQLIVAGALTLLLTGCAYLPHKPLVDGVTTASPAAAATTTANGSVFQTGQAMSYGYQPMFEDRRPRNVGDTLTIVLQENVSASKSSSANANRGGSTDLSVDAVPSMLAGLLGGDRAATSISGKNDFSGKGGAAAKNTFSGTITVTVQQLLENGNLKVVGEKQIAINQGTEFIRFSGVVNPRTISSSNTVISTQVADARIEYVGNGYINEAQQMGWLQRLFLNLSPY